MTRYRCGECGRSRPDEETTRVHGHSTGDYRRAGRRIWRRVCRDCTQRRVDYARQAQTGEVPFNAPVDSHHVVWSQAASDFGIDLTGLVLRSGGKPVGS